MATDATFSTLALAGLAHRCRQESELYFQRQPFDPRYCYELFRRALVERIDRAWELLYTHYHSQVRQWVQLHPSFAASGGAADEFVNCAFAKMWSAIKGEKFGNFADLKALLEYLKLCVASCVIDYGRSERLHQQQQSLFYGTQDGADSLGRHDPDVAQTILDELARAELWQRIRQRLHDEREYNLLYARFVLGLLPKAICQRFPQEFPDVNEVYTLLQNILARLRRDPGLRKLLGDNA